MIKKYINKFKKSELAKNSLTMVSGTTLAQLLPIAVSPILSRIYKPEDFGVLALFMSLTIVLSIVAGGRYELSIVLPKKDSEGINLLALTLIVSGVFSVVLMVLMIFFHDFFVNLLGEQKISVWLYILPFVVFFVAAYNAFSYYFTRLKKYKQLATFKILRSSVLAIFQTGLFFLHSGIFALLGGYSLSQFGGSAVMVREAFKNKELNKQIKKTKIIALAKKYDKFPKSTMFASLFNKGSSEMPNLTFAAMFDTATLGFYSMGYRLLSIPSAFIGMSISQVFMQAANQERLETGKAVKIFKSVFIKLFVFGLLFFAVIAVVAKPLFAFVYGKEWAIAGTYAMLLTPLLFTRFVTSTLSSILFVFEKHSIILLLQISLFVLSVLIFVVTYFLKIDFQIFLLIYSLSLSVFYLIYLFILWLVSNSKI